MLFSLSDKAGMLKDGTLKGEEDCIKWYIEVDISPKVAEM